MQTKTLALLNTLRIGDSFVFQNRTDVWHITAKADKNGKVAINQYINGRFIYAHDTLKKGNTYVLFLRHTVPVPGEEIFLEDLKPGDVFTRPEEDNFFEWELVNNKAHDFYDVRRSDQAAPGKGGRLTKVIFVRHKD